MPASKRELSPPESESKIRKLDEDGDAMPSKVATILNIGNSPERTAAPRTKKKLSPSPGGNNSRPCSPLSDSSESVSDPPFKKAKLLSTSAFSTLSSEESKSNTSLVQTTLTESDEASIGSINTNFIRGKDGNDKAPCIIQYSNKVKAEELPCSPSDPVQTDHSYGRVSDITETDQDVKILKEDTHLVPELERPNVTTESIDASTVNLTKCEAKPSHCVRMHLLESQKTDNIIIDSCSDFLDNGTSIVALEEEKEETSSELQCGNKILLFSENVEPDEIERPDTLREGLFQGPTVLVREHFDQDVKFHTEETYHETLVEETGTDFTISHPLLTKNSEQILAVSSRPERHSNDSVSTLQRVTNLEQTDNVQFNAEETAGLEKMQDQVSNAFTNTSGHINEITEKLHKNETEQKMGMVTSGNECCSQNIMSNKKEINKDQEGHDDYRVIDSTPGVIGDSLLETEIPYIEDAAILNGQLSVEIPTEFSDGITYAAVEMPHCETQIILGRQTESSSSSSNKMVKSDCFSEATEPDSGIPQNVSEDLAPNYETTAVSPALHETICSVPTVDVQAEIQLNTSNQYFKEPELKTCELHKDFVQHQIKNIGRPESSEIIHQEIVVALNLEESVISEQSTHASSQIEDETIPSESKDEVEGNHGGSAIVPVSPTALTDVQDEIQLNTSDQYFKEPEGETFGLQEESLRHQAKTTNYPESSEIIHQEIVVAVNMENSVISEQSTYVSSQIEDETITAGSKVEGNHDCSAVHVSPTVPPVDVQCEIQLNTSDQYFKEPEGETLEVQEESLKHQTKTIVISEQSTRVSSKIENETITAEFKDDAEGNPDASAVPINSTVDVEGEIQLNTSDHYFKESEGETFELQEDCLKHQTKTISYPESSEVIHPEIVVAIDMKNSVASEQSTHVLNKIENETVTAESKDEIESNHDGSAIVPVSPLDVEMISPLESALSPKTCSRYQEVSETSELSEVNQVDYSTATEVDNEGHVGSPVIHTDKVQRNVLPHIFSASTTDEINTPSVEMCLVVSEASNETVMVHNVQNIVSREMVVSEDQINISSEEIPISSTVIAFESLTGQAEDVQESFISNAFTEHSEDDVAKYYTTNVQAMATSEISVPTSTVVLDTNNGQEVSFPDSDIDHVNNDNVEELRTDCADTIPMELQLQNTVEEKISVHEVMTEHVDGQTITIPEEGEVAPSVVVSEEAEHSITFFGEIQSYQSHSENIEGEQIQTEPIVVDTQEDNAVISESQEIECATNFIETNEGAVDGRDLTSETKQALLNTEEHDVQNNDETIIVAFQQEDVHRVEEPNKIGTDVKKHENEIVYEPISSPESTTDGEVPTLPENNDTVRLMHTDIINTSQIIYSVSALSDKEMVVSDGYGIAQIPSVPPESSAVISPIEEFEVHGKSFQNNKSVSDHCVFDNQTEFHSSQTDILSSVSQNEENSQMNNRELKNEEYSDNQVMSEAHPAAEMQSTVQITACEQLEQSNGTEDMKVLVTSANEDAPDGQLENTEEKSEESVITHSVFTEQVQELTGPEAVVGAEATAVTFTTENQENQEADSTCEEYVILEPVPVTAIHYDIITQAVAESGLSEEINTNTESIIAEVQQTSVTKDDVTEEITQETMVVDKTLENSEQVEEIGVSTQTTEAMEMTPANCVPDVTQPVDINMDPPECQILEDIEIGREIVVAEEEQEEDSDISIIEKPQEYTTEEAEKTIKDETNKDTGNETSKETLSLDTAKKDSTTAANKEPEKPKKQEMNTQARTKARLAALAEQKAAASKRQSRREQLNLLALCQEIAEDIATDSMLLKKIEEEKQAAAAAAAKTSEVNKNESQPVYSQDEHPEDAVAPTPERAEASSSAVAPAEDSAVNQPTPNADHPKAVTEPPKRRFFTSQVSVPLKVHEKKKLTRYQRLRQVELQREKMSWARVKKLKSDQANQMFSEMDWQASMSFSSFAMDHVETAPQPVASLSKPPSPGLSSANKPAPNAEEPKVEVSKPEPLVSEPANVVMPQSGPSKAAREKKTEADKTQKENSKAEPTKPELRKSSRISKIESSKAATPATATKGKATSKKVLPAVPPPMPNGLNNQSLKIEYKPYKPRPKYSPDDFELDDDPFPPPKACPQAMSTHQTRPNVQGRPASQAPTPSKTTVSTQPSNQLKSHVLTPAGQISGQTKPASSSPANPPAAQTLSKGTYATPSSTSSSKLLPTTEALQKTPVSTSPQSKVAIAPTESKPAAASLPQVKLTSTISQKETTSSVNQPAPSDTTSAAPPDDTPGPAKCKATEDAPVDSVLPKEDTNVSNDTQKSDENKKATGGHPETKTELEESDLNKASKLCQDQNVETSMSDTSLHKEIKKLKEADKDCTQTIIDAGQKHFGPVACSVCGMLYTAANPEDESQHLLFHNQFISAVKYVGWKKERILSEFPDGKIILVLPDDPKYALKKIEEIREMVDNDLGFQQVESKCPSKTKTFLFISNDKKVAGCLIAEHINEGYRVIEELVPSGSEGEKVMFERQRAWCCSTTAEPAICGISRIWVVNTMRRQGIASRMLDCLRNNFIYGSNLSKDEIAFSDPTPDGKLFATHYFGTSQFLVYNFVNGTPTSQAKTEKV